MSNIQRAVAQAASVITAMLLATGGVQSAEPATKIDQALQNITALVRPSKVGYATVWDGNRYVQCRRLLDGGYRCEGAGSVLQPSLKAVLTGERLNRLAALGWTIDPAFGNFVQLPPRSPIKSSMPSPKAMARTRLIWNSARRGSTMCPARRVTARRRTLLA